VVELGRVSSLDQFVRTVADRTRRWQAHWNIQTESSWLPWFRGEQDANQPTRLKPKLYRSQEGRKKLLRQEQDLRMEFRRRGSQFAGEGKPSDHWEWYFLMQHYGVPTRLLDWTDGALVALYFALKPADTTHDAAVYMLDPWWLNDLVFKTFPISKQERSRGSALPDWPEAAEYLSQDEFQNEYVGPKPALAIDPSHVARRFAAQRSRFIIFGRSKDGLVKTCAKIPDKDCRLCRVRIKGAAVDDMRNDLVMCGISESMIFPDLEGFGRELNAMFQERWMTSKP
jgi:hypothetical protein